MKTKLPFLMLALLPFASFGQNAVNKKLSKELVYPVKVQKANVPLATLSYAYAPAAYCIPSVALCDDGDIITNVTIGEINNTTTCSTDGYGDYSAMQANVEAGQSYPISVTVGDGWFERVSAWVDFNNNEVFDADEFLEIGDGSDFAVTTLTGSIAVPSTVASGSYRMRIMVAAVGTDGVAITDACAPPAYGEVEDYTLVVATVAPEGCLTAPNGQYPSAAYVPTCNGAVGNITTAGYAGEYSVVTVTSGTAYTFSVSNPAYFITIGDSAGATVLASGTGSVVWTANLSGNIRFYSHTDSACGSGTSATLHTRSVLCGEVPPPPVEPDYGCDQTYDGVPDLASNITKVITGSAASYALANDFFVPMESEMYKMNSMTINLVPLAASGGADIESFDINLLSDSGSNTPGAVVKTWTAVVPTSVTSLPDTFAGYPTFAATVDLGAYELPVNAAADTRYWVSVQANSATTTSIYWIGYKYNEGWVTAPNYQSSDAGATYVITTSTTAPGQHYDSNWSLDAECIGAAVTEAGNKNVSFYPNPVKDVLTINSKKSIETVHVYNVAGQKMPVSTKVVNGKVDMSKLAPGVYIISTILDGGINESFKVIKK